MFVFFMVFLLGRELSARTFYVDVNSHELGEGSQHRPYRLIQNALNRAQPGTVIKIASGRYRELLKLSHSGTKDEPIVIEPWKEGRPEIDGTFFESEKLRALLYLNNVSYVRVKGLSFKGIKAQHAQDAVYGILLEGYGEGVQLQDLELSQFGVKNGISLNSHAILIEGENESLPIRQLLLNNLVIYNCEGLGSLISLRGNVEDALLEGNHLHGNGSSGIELLGDQNTSQSALVDRPRRTVLRRNYLHDNHRRSRLSNGDFVAAKGIVVDNCEDAIIENNRIISNDAGLELKSSSKGLGLREMIVRNNWFQMNESSAITLGSEDFNLGRCEKIRIFNNTMIENDQAGAGRGEIYFQFNVANCVVKNNFFIPKPAAGQSVYLAQVSKKQVPSELFLSNNFYVERGEQAVWKIGYQSSVGFEEWMRQGYDRQSQGGKLLFDNKGMPHSLEQIRDKGDSQVAQSSEDIDGNPRLLGAALDIGAKEW